MNILISSRYQPLAVRAGLSGLRFPGKAERWPPTSSSDRLQTACTNKPKRLWKAGALPLSCASPSLSRCSEQRQSDGAGARPLPRGPGAAGQGHTAATTSAPAALAGAGQRQSYRDAWLRLFWVFFVSSSLPPALSVNFRHCPARHGATTSSASRVALGAAGPEGDGSDSPPQAAAAPELLSAAGPGRLAL